MAKETKLADLAKALGISKTTVSSALTGNRYVSEKTRQRVLKAARDLRYSPNVFARGLRTRESKVIGVIVSDMSEPFLGLLVRNLEMELKKNGYRMFLASYYFDPEEETRLIRSFEAYMVDGIITISGSSENNRAYKEASEAVPVVLLYRDPGRLSLARVSIDFRKMFRDGTQYLVSRGHRRIAVFTLSENDLSTTGAVLEGYKEAILANGLPFDEDLIVKGRKLLLHEIPASIQLAQRIMDLGVSALFGITDYIAVGLVKGLSNIGVKIPQDLSVLSLTNVDYGLTTVPALSSIDFAPHLAAQAALQAIRKMKSSTRTICPNVELPFKIVERDTVLRVASGQT